MENDENRAVLIGITGGIGSGKSSASHILKQRGYSVISADDVARYVMEQDEYVRWQLLVEFGDRMYHKNGDLNREHIADIVFNAKNKEKLKRLNAIVHPRTLDKILDIAEGLEEKGEKHIFVEIALLYEAGLDDAFDYIVAVFAPLETRLQRIKERNPDWSDEHTQERIKEQADQGWVKNQSDFVLDNSGDMTHLEKAVDFLLGIVPFLPPVFNEEENEPDVENEENSEEKE